MIPKIDQFHSKFSTFLFVFAFSPQGYSQDMLSRLHATSQYSAEHQLYTLMYELLTQESITANDFKTRIYEIMSGMHCTELSTVFIQIIIYVFVR